MKRRDAVKGIILFSLGTSIIYSCTDKYKAIRDLKLHYFQPKDSELDVIETLSRVILPIHTIPELAMHTPLPLMFTMLDDVYKPEDRTAFLEGYQNFDRLVEVSEGSTFSQMKEEDQKAYVKRMNKAESGIDEVLTNFFKIVKAESLRYFKTSEYFQRKVNYYEMAPGRFNGDVLISELKNANAV